MGEKVIKMFPLVIYRRGSRYVISTVWASVDEDLDTSGLEVDITNPILTKIREEKDR